MQAQVVNVIQLKIWNSQPVTQVAPLFPNHIHDDV